jgi:hypothetical protein
MQQSRIFLLLLVIAFAMFPARSLSDVIISYHGDVLVEAMMTRQFRQLCAEMREIAPIHPEEMDLPMQSTSMGNCVEHFEHHGALALCEAMEKEAGVSCQSAELVFRQETEKRLPKICSAYVNRTRSSLEKVGPVPVIEHTAQSEKWILDLIKSVATTATHVHDSSTESMRQFIVEYMKCVCSDIIPDEYPEENLGATVQQIGWCPSVRCLVGWVDIELQRTAGEFLTRHVQDVETLTAHNTDMIFVVSPM